MTYLPPRFEEMFWIAVISFTTVYDTPLIPTVGVAPVSEIFLFCFIKYPPPYKREIPALFPVAEIFSFI